MENEEIPRFIYPIPFEAFLEYQKEYSGKEVNYPKHQELQKLKKVRC